MAIKSNHHRQDLYCHNERENESEITVMSPGEYILSDIIPP